MLLAETARLDRVFETHSQGGRPFRVEVATDGCAVRVCALAWDDSFCPGGTAYVDATLSVSAARVWVGQSRRCAATETGGGGYGPHLDGNTVLLQRTDPHHPFGPYVWVVGDSVLSLAPLDGALVVAYESPVGNGDVPYPYAIDARGVVYLPLAERGEPCVVALTRDGTARAPDDAVHPFSAFTVACQLGTLVAGRCDWRVEQLAASAVLHPPTVGADPVALVLAAVDEGRLVGWCVEESEAPPPIGRPPVPALYAFVWLAQPETTWRRLVPAGSVASLLLTDGTRLRWTCAHCVIVMRAFAERLGVHVVPTHQLLSASPSA
jgi:hypothetical protein